MSARKLPQEPRWISEPTLLAIHAQLIERYGGAHGFIDANLVLSALARPINRWHHDENADLADLAAVYLIAFGQAQGFRDGNKRTGLACALVFLSLNRAPLHVPAGELYTLCMRVATNQADDAQVARYIRSRIGGTSLSSST